MKDLCEWLCPKTKKKQSYDVHEDTFQMDQNIGEIDIADKSPPKENVQSNQHFQELKQKAEDEEERKFVQEKNKLQENLNKPQQAVQEKEVQKVAEVVVEKPKPKYNILPSKASFKKQFNPADFMFKNEEDQFKVKLIDSLKGQQFNIENCKRSFYFIFDVTANIYVDDCEDCFIFAAPCESSIFVRSCKNMVVVGITGQFRVYNCHNSHFSLLCKSQPVIESSSQIHFSCLECPEYAQLLDQMIKIKLYPWNNNWSQIHNFTPEEGVNHHTLHRHRIYETEVNWEKAFESANLQVVNEKQQVTPFIQGNLPIEEMLEQTEEENSKVLLIFGAQSSQNDKQILQWIYKNNLNILKASKIKQEAGGNDLINILFKKQNNEQQLDLSEIGNPTMFTEKEQISKHEGKCFVSFGDER